MAAELGDLLQLIDNQSYQGQQVLNVYYYRVVSITGLDGTYLEALNGYWEEGVLAPILDIQLDELTHVTREWRNLSNGIDLFTATEVIPGNDPGSSGGALPSFISLGFLLRRESLTTRNGYKRLAGLDEALVEGNEYVGDMTPIHAIEDALAVDIFGGLVDLLEPIIVKRPIEPPVGSYLYSSIGSAEFRGVGTQNTRKPGRGT